MKKIVNTLLILSIVLSPVIAKGINVDNSDLQIQQLNISQYESLAPYKVEAIESDEEKFVKDLAKSKGLSYEEAKKINDENTMEYFISRRPDLETRYTTESQYYRINSDLSLVMSVEVKYIHNNETNKNQIASVGEPYMGINGTSSYRWSGSGFNKEVGVDVARISTTGQAYVEINNNVSSGFDLSGLIYSHSTGYSKIYTTGVKTYVMTIRAKYL